MLIRTQRTPRRFQISSFGQQLTLDHLWLITVLALVWAFISVLPLPPNDLWWHMAAGRTMVAEGAWLHTNRWAYTVPLDATYVFQSWLSEIALYGVWWLGDVPLLMLTRSLVIVAGYGLVAWHGLRRSGSGKAAALALVLAILISWNNWTLRPQTLAILPGAAFVVILDGYVRHTVHARWLLWLPVLMLVWVNMHGSFILGAVLLALAWLGAAIAFVQRRQPTPMSRDRLRWLSCIGLATCGALLINPLGVGIFGYVRMLFGNNDVQTRIAEWQPLRNDFNLSGTGFWFFAVLLLLAVLMATGTRRPSATDLLWYCGLAWLGISAGRHAMWFALFLMPLLAEQIAPVFRQRAGRAYAGLHSLYCLLLGGMVIAVLPWFAPARYLGPNARNLYAATGPHQMLLSSTTPIAATDWLAQHPIEGRFWVDMSYSSYTIWQLPEHHVFADLRIELFPNTVWDDYFDLAQGDERSLQVIDRWQITHLMFDVHGQASLRTILLRTPGWCEPYNDQTTAIVARCSLIGTR